MTESEETRTWGECVQSELEHTHERFALQWRGKKSMEEALATTRTQTVLTITDQPGGRLLVYVEVYGKHHGQKVTSYNRYQRIPGSGYVRVYHRDM